MKILIAPLNWGLGHATRCIPIIHQYLADGHEVVIGGDGESLILLRKKFPALRVITFPSLRLQYTKNHSLRGFYLRALLSLIRFTLADYFYLRQKLAIENFDLLISDNRFGFFSRETRSVYITHQLYPILPNRLRIFQPLARTLHACIYSRYDEIWVPDYADSTNNLSGKLSHGGDYDHKVKYIGPLSRFSLLLSNNTIKGYHSEANYSVVAILSGLEPQRTLFEKDLIKRYYNHDTPVLIVRGKVEGPTTTTQLGSTTLLSHIDDDQLRPILLQAPKIIARSGYSTIMDLEILGLLHKAELHPTPGQSEQEYLSNILRK